MKQWEIRTKDLKTVVFYDRSKSMAIDDLRQMLYPNQVVVEHIFKSPAEADKARLDHIESKCALTHVVCGPGVRQALDLERQAPQPTVRVIATPDGPVDPA